MYRALLTSSLLLFLLSVGSETLAQDKKKTLKVAAVDREALRSRLAPERGIMLRDDAGREVRATLLSAHGETVRIQRLDDEREFEVLIDTFDSHTEERIRSWIAQDPEAVDYSLDIRAVRNLSGSDTFESLGRSITTKKWSYHVTVTNQTRNELNDAQVEFRVVYDDHVAFSRTSPYPGEGEDQQEGQAVDLPAMEFNDQIEFDTPVLETHAYEYNPTRGKREEIKDSIKGIWIRVVRHGKILAEFKSNEAFMRSLSWDNEDEVEIRITNKFRDSFEDSPGSE